MIGGNTIGIVQKKTGTIRNAIGEAVPRYEESFRTVGWLGLQSGEYKRSSFFAKIEESTHVFLCDYHAEIYALASLDTRMVIKGFMYDVLLIDNPDEMDEQLEIYLRRVGAVNG